MDESCVMVSRGVVVAAGLAALLIGTVNPVGAAVLVTIDKATQRMTVSVDGERRYTWPVSTGRTGYATPSGSFKPFRLEKDHYSREWDDAPMPNSIFFTQKGHAIHGSFETRRLGSPASHGCVRLAPANAATLFALVKAQGLGNTKIVLSGEAPRMIAKPRPPAGEPMDLQQQQSSNAGPPGLQQPYGTQPQYPVQSQYPMQPQYPAFGQPRYPQPAYGQPTFGGPIFGQPQYPPQGYYYAR
jgi:L,D-transpeptidase catalytic domain